MGTKPKGDTGSEEKIERDLGGLLRVTWIWHQRHWVLGECVRKLNLVDILETEQLQTQMINKGFKVYHKLNLVYILANIWAKTLPQIFKMTRYMCLY